MPELSILIPNYNYAHFLPECIDSILSQDYQDFEIVIADDGSTDGSPELIEALAQKEPRIRPLLFKENRGLHPLLHASFPELRGTYVKQMSPDDLLLPGFLSSSLPLLKQHPEVGMVCADFRYFGREEREIRALDTTTTQIFNKADIVRTFHTTSFRVAGPTCITKRGLIEQYGGYRKELANLDDWYLFHKIALYEGVAYIPKVLFALRQQDNSLTDAIKASPKRRKATYWALLSLLEEERQTRQLFRASGTLDFIFENLFWKVLFNPKYWPYFPPLKHPLKKRLFRSLRKRFL